ncbi:DUF1700 domain-containing protein [Streptococcus sp. NLN64]|uniref:DUF1700 domain-containing protein n=1 Tax=Streptococcus sp. NLN64 TaxID=2822799 RepID=UPI0018CB73A7|nr:DUF1700 domain-containing protein [Streptococcus sp. NLN64]MBG9368017.1 DUF1700 domain-containing protein [Streptococcus sp. NLN64]
MKKDEYLSQLDHYLRKLPREDYQEAIEHFQEYFEDAGPENEAALMEELGSPKEAAYDLIQNLLDKELSASQPTKRTFWKIPTLITLVILASPLALPIALFFIVLLFTILALFGAFLFTLLILGMTGILTSIAAFYESFRNLISSPASFAFGIGAGTFLLGLGSLLCLLTYSIGTSTVKLLGWIYRTSLKGDKR